MELNNYSVDKDTPKEDIDKYLHELKAHQTWWANQVSLNERIDLLKRLQKNILMVIDKWIALDTESRNTETTHWDYVVPVITPGCVGLIVRLYLQALYTIRDCGKPKFAKKIQQDGDRVQFQIFPQGLQDRVLWGSTKARVYLKQGTCIADFEQYQSVYQDPNDLGAIALVLASGNYAHLTISDTLHKLIAEKNVVLIKINPVKAYLFSIMTEIFQPFIDAGVVRIISGGPAVGHYAAYHPLVNNLHMTGSDKTFESIVYGSGDVGIENKKNDRRVLTIPITGELGCVTPVIIVPGEWSEKDFHYQAKNIVSMLGLNSGYTCCAPRVLIMPKTWGGSLKLLNLIRHYMTELSIASNYYPGTEECIQRLETQYPHLEKIGLQDATHQPWMLITDLHPELDEYAFRVEVWAAFMSQVYLADEDVASYLNTAVAFANNKLWGTLSAMILVDAKTRKKLEKTGCLPRAIRELHYGVVTINLFSGYANSLGILPWGGYPGSDYSNIQSGNAYVNNMMLLKNVEKTVLEGPFRLWPEIPLFISHKKLVAAGIMFSYYNITGRWRDFFKLIGAVLGVIHPKLES